MRLGVENQKMAEEHRGKALGIEAALERTIFSDDENAVEALEEKIRGLEAERARNNELNKAIRRELKKGFGWIDRIGATETEKETIRISLKYSRSVTIPSVIIALQHPGQMGGLIRQSPVPATVRQLAKLTAGVLARKSPVRLNLPDETQSLDHGLAQVGLCSVGASGQARRGHLQFVPGVSTELGSIIVGSKLLIADGSFHVFSLSGSFNPARVPRCGFCSGPSASSVGDENRC
jgi:hypothetical protein